MLEFGDDILIRCIDVASGLTSGTVEERARLAIINVLGQSGYTGNVTIQKAFFIRLQQALLYSEEKT